MSRKYQERKNLSISKRKKAKKKIGMEVILIRKRSMARNKLMKTQKNMKWTMVKLKIPINLKVKMNKFQQIQAQNQKTQNK
jgi:hypothetical protein